MKKKFEKVSVGFLDVFVKITSILRFLLLLAIPFFIYATADAVQQWISSNAKLINSALDFSQILKLSYNIDLVEILRNMTLKLFLELFAKLCMYAYIVIFSLLIAFKRKWLERTFLNSRVAFVFYILAEFALIVFLIQWLRTVNVVAHPGDAYGLGGLLDGFLQPFGGLQNVIALAKNTATVMTLTLVTSILTAAFVIYHFVKLERDNKYI